MFSRKELILLVLACTLCLASGSATAWHVKINGTNGNDPNLVGTNNHDTVAGYLGADTAKGKDNPDPGCCGQYDVVDGGGGGDTVYGGYGKDSVRGNNGSDEVHGGSAADIYVSGNSGGDSVFGDEHGDFVQDESGIDTVRGGGGNDILDVKDGSGGDVIWGGDGVDSCQKDPGDTKHDCE